jgi:hypothetical protein
MATASDIVTGALRVLNAYAVGQPLDPGDAQDALAVLNQMVEAWSIEHYAVFNVQENILAWNPGQYQYTIGSPALGTSGATFVATVTSGSPTITYAGGVPVNMQAGASIYDSGGAIPAGAKILNATGTTVTMSANATATVASDTITYSGYFNIPLPNRIVSGYTRLVASANLDYPFDIIDQVMYQNIGIKNLPGPWPTAVYYQRASPIGMLYVYKVPQNGGELHLWTDSILTQFSTLTAQVQMPSGYTRALIYNLATELAPRYGRPVTPDVRRAARESIEAIKALNQRPTQETSYELGMAGSRRMQDAGWIMHGGFR